MTLDELIESVDKRIEEYEEAVRSNNTAITEHQRSVVALQDDTRERIKSLTGLKNRRQTLVEVVEMLKFPPAEPEANGNGNSESVKVIDRVRQAVTQQSGRHGDIAKRVGMKNVGYHLWTLKTRGKVRNVNGMWEAVQ